MDAGFIRVVEIGQYFLTEGNGEQFMQRLIVNTFFQEVTDHHNQKGGSRETQKLSPFWKLQPIVFMVNMDLSQNLVFEERQLSTMGQNFSWIK